ncbi:Integrase [Lysinibacillus sphaericus]|nr:Integrase [Lysinibacillus sphaericus]
MFVVASYRKRNGLWQARVTYLDPRTGKYKEKSLSGYKTKKEAQIAAEKMEVSIRRGVDIQGTNQTLTEYFDWWFETYKKGSVSWASEQNILKNVQMVASRIGNYALKDLNRPNYQKFINSLSTEYALSTIKRMNSTISESFEEAVIEGLLTYNPAARIKYPVNTKPSKRKKLTLELEDYAQLIKWIETEWMADYPHYVYITHMLVATGARIGEVCALYDADMRFEEKLLNIDKTIVKVERKFTVKPTTKTGTSGERIIAIDDFTLRKMKEWKAIRAKMVLRLGHERPPFFFINADGRNVSMNAYGDMLRKLCERHNFMHVTPHMFKHTHETILWESDVADLNYIGARLGNTDKSILLNTYGHMSKQSEQTNNKKINDYMQRWLSHLD